MLYRIDWLTLKGVLVAQDGKSSPDQFPKTINIYKQKSVYSTESTSWFHSIASCFALSTNLQI